MSPEKAMASDARLLSASGGGYRAQRSTPSSICPRYLRDFTAHLDFPRRRCRATQTLLMAECRRGLLIAQIEFFICAEASSESPSPPTEARSVLCGQLSASRKICRLRAGGLALPD